MTRDEIIEIARQAATGMPGFTSRTKNPTSAELEFYKRLTNRAVAKEREACAKVCDELIAPDVYSDTDISMWDVTCMDCAAAIRARGQA